MKKIWSIFLALAICLSGVFIGDSYAAKPEMRAAWVSTVFNIDWPSKASYGNVSKQKQEYIYMIDRLKEAGINTVVVQVRPEGDALYPSSINPWSRYLTGTQGRDPGYDPLKFMIEETHKRGMEFHAWFNPYRASIYDDISSLASNNPVRSHMDWVIHYKGKWYFDPGLPQVRKLVVDSITEVVRNYDVDAVHFDDYFYPAADFPDRETFNKYGNGKDLAQWRRENVNQLLYEVKTNIKSIKPWVEFGVSPGGIWRNRKNTSLGSPTDGGETYVKHSADTVAWIKRGLVDYVVPQVYWKMDHPKAPYNKLIDWWAKQVVGTNVKLYIGQGIYKKGQSDYNGENVSAEIYDQVRLNRDYSYIQGSMYFSAKDVIYNSQVNRDIKRLNSSWAPTPTTKRNNPSPRPVEPVAPAVSSKHIYGKDRTETAVKISKEGWGSGADTVVISEGYDVYDSALASTLASAYNSPLLLSSKGKLREATKTELYRLNPSSVILISRNDAKSSELSSDINAVIPNASVERIVDSSLQKLSAKIAYEIKKVSTVDSVYFAGESADVDVLSICGKAGEEKQVILVTGRDSVDPDVNNFLDNTPLKRCYYIGGPSMLSDNVASQLSERVGNDYRRNRVYGVNRYETNAKVVDAFYKNGNYKVVFATKGNPIIDAVSIGPLAVKYKSPILILGNKIHPHQKRIYTTKKSDYVYRIGGGINANSYNALLNMLK